MRPGNSRRRQLVWQLWPRRKDHDAVFLVIIAVAVVPSYALGRFFDRLPRRGLAPAPVVLT